ncbi:MAG: hypothetical protein FH748_10025 [Balneolaceae bacterium]|nr:hypothetical protein [Balneolaceae bacterium]
MLIGGDFNQKAKHLILLLDQLSKSNSEQKIEVERIVKEMGMDRVEVKNLLEYLENKEFIDVATIGGPFLYGHITITERGILKAKSLK